MFMVVNLFSYFQFNSTQIPKLLFLFLVLSFGCKKNPQLQKMKEAIQKNDYMTIATLCSEYKFEEYKSECESSLAKSEEEIQEIISKKQELPFMKFLLEPEKSIKIQELLKTNIEFGIKYRAIWNETAELYKE